MRSRARHPTYFLSVVLLIGCAPSPAVYKAHATVVRFFDRPPKADNCDIQIFSSRHEITRPHKVVCKIEAHISDASSVEALTAAQVAACRCGADAMVVKGFSTGIYTTGSTSMRHGRWTFTNDDVRERGVAVIEGISFSKRKERESQIAPIQPPPAPSSDITSPAQETNLNEQTHSVGQIPDATRD